MPRRLSSYFGLRDYLEGSIPIHSIRGKAAAIQRENPVCSQLFAQHNQGGVGKIHWDIAISLHQSRNPLQAFRRGRNQVKSASENKLKANFLRAPLGSDQIERFGQHGFSGDDRAGPVLQRRYAVTVQLLVPIHERHESPGIQQQFIFHGAIDGSDSRGGVARDRSGRWQYLPSKSRTRSMGRTSGWVSRYCSKASRTTSERLRFKRLADRSSFAAKSAGRRMLNCRSICFAS